MSVDAGPIDVAIETEDRYSRLRLIPWWDQEKLHQSRVLVVGAGALGNEILKNLALLGFGRVYLIDMDRIENSNLSRSVLFREGDEGRPKATVAAERIAGINPDVAVRTHVGNVMHDVGLGVFRSMDLVLCGLDSREARVAVNEKCWRVGRPWIDGAIEVLFGVARVFIPPDGACYECTMSDADRRALSLRRSCALLSRDDLLAGKVPTTPTTASIIAGVQVQEAVKLLHRSRELPVLRSRGFVFNGLTHDSYVVSYQPRAQCMNHFTFGEVIETDWEASETTLGRALEYARQELGKDAVLDLNQEILTGLACRGCGSSEPVFRPLGTITDDRARCPTCGQPRLPETTHSVLGDEPYIHLTFAEVGLPSCHIVTARSGFDMRHLEFTGDRARTLGAIC